ncbi:DUF6185 family protein [Actinosynnema sp. NPDC050436]|uniref:DUF6185 family protein n=1 Tax=Actinosynnema sp. NPDC050436 TaxID=3155659 RepID=UPI00340CA333
MGSGRVAAGLVGLLLAGTAAAVLVVANGSEGREVHGDFACAPGSLPGARVVAEATVDAARRDFPRVAGRVEISLPATDPLVPALLAPVGDSAYRGALRCLLGRGREEDRPAEIRAAPASVTVEGDRVKVVDDVHADVVGTPDLAVGVFRVSAPAPDRWQVTLQPPPALSAATWTRVSVRTPADWSSTPEQPPAAHTAVETAWTPDRAGPLAVTLVPDGRVLLGATSVTHPWYALALALSWLSQVVVAVGLVLWVRRSPVPAGARAEALRSVVPVAVVAVAVAVADVATQVFLGAPGTDADWRLVGWVEGLAVLALFGFCAVRRRVRPRPLPALLLTAVVVAALPIVWTYQGWPSSVPVNPLSVTVKAAFVLLLGTVVAAGAAQAFGTARHLRSSYRIGPWAWVGAAVVAVLLVVDRVFADVVTTGRVRWLSPFPVDAASVCCTFDRFPAQLAEDVSGLLLLIPVVALWALAKQHVAQNEHVDVRWLKTTAGVLFFVGVLDWGVQLRGWTVPVWAVVGVVVLLVFRRLRSPLDRVVSATGATVRDTVARSGLDVLRGHVAEALTTEGAGRRGKRLRGKGSDALAGLTPAEVLLAAGPGATPVANARHAIRYALLLGLPVNLLLNGGEWVGGLSTAQRPSSYLFDAALLACWLVVRWLVTGAVVGLLWQHLPGRSGPVRVLPVVALFVGTRLVSDGLLRLADAQAREAPLVGAALYAVVLVAVGWLMDRRTLKALRSAEPLP